MSVFMNDKCGLVDPANPCRCARKTRGFIEAGYVDPQNLLFPRERVREVRSGAPARVEALAALDRACADIFRRHPLHDAPDFVGALRRLLASSAFAEATDAPFAG